jgi:hypothetical protein
LDGVRGIAVLLAIVVHVGLLDGGDASTVCGGLTPRRRSLVLG